MHEVIFHLKSLKELDEISKYLKKKGDTQIRIKISNLHKDFDFKLENRRNIDRKTINLLRNKEILASIS